MVKSLKLTAIGAAVLGCLIVSPTAEAWRNANETTYLTFSGPVALPGVELRAGTYIFERASSEFPNVIRVSSRDRSKVYLLTFTLDTPRPTNLPPGGLVSMGEAPRGAAAPIQAWFPANSETGHEFVYSR